MRDVVVLQRCERRAVAGEGVRWSSLARRRYTPRNNEGSGWAVGSAITSQVVATCLMSKRDEERGMRCPALWQEKRLAQTMGVRVAETEY